MPSRQDSNEMLIDAFSPVYGVSHGRPRSLSLRSVGGMSTSAKSMRRKFRAF